MTALDPIKCLKQTKYRRLLITRALISELPSNISTVIKSDSKKANKCYN